MNIDDRPTDRRPTTDLRAYSHILGKFHMDITLQRQPIAFMFGSRVGFSGTTDRTAPFPVGSN